MIHGILNVDKPYGMTSHRVIRHVRAILGQRRVGHAGTLDPIATGVLLVCLGRGTRMSEYLMEFDKVYRARVRLGVTTDTYDIEGQVIETRPVEVDRETVEMALTRFRGSIQQVPPMYSALKKDGKPLYKLARQGVTVDRPARALEISRLQMTAWEPPDITLEIRCSSGTYVRSLAYDLGQVLGCGAYLVGLMRLASGDFRLEESTPLNELTRERLPEILSPMDAALSRYPAFHLDADRTRRVRCGLAIEAAPPEEHTLARAYGPEGRFLAVLVFQPDKGVWHPRKVFWPIGE